MIEQIYEFKLRGMPKTYEPYGNGHINTTYRVCTDAGYDYILQKINRVVFPDIEALMRNIESVTDFLRRRTLSQRCVLTIVPTVDDASFYLDDEGEYWRVYEFVTNSFTIERAQSPHDMYECGRALGCFQSALCTFDAVRLNPVIPGFHDTPGRFMKLMQSVKDDFASRAASVKREIDFVTLREEYIMGISKLNDMLPIRVTHNDTKLNNVLFDKDTRKAVCVIDLDTVMPGLCVNDFGDGVRFGASTAAEDERELDKVTISLPLFEAFTRGYLSNCALTDDERSQLYYGVLAMTLECGIRFLTDYLNGDIYFRTAYEKHNLDRARAQFALTVDIERKRCKMNHIIEGRCRI